MSTDQDNAIIFQPQDGEDVDALRVRLMAFGAAVNQLLAACGFPLCVGGIMAGQADCCLTLDEWRARFIQWVRSPVPEAVLKAAIFFDLRPIFGQESLASGLRDLILSLSHERDLFLRQLAVSALEAEPPLGVLRDFVVDSSSEHPGTIDLKAGGIRIFVDAARVLALARGVRATNTAERLRGSSEGGVTDKETRATIDAFYFLQVLRLKHQINLREGDHPNRVAPDDLNNLERRVLKESLRLAKLLQSRLRLDYRL